MIDKTAKINYNHPQTVKHHRVSHETHLATYEGKRMVHSYDSLYSHVHHIIKLLSVTTGRILTMVFIFSCKPIIDTPPHNSSDHNAILSVSVTPYDSSVSPYSLYLSSAQKQGTYQFEICQNSKLNDLLNQICTPALLNESGQPIVFSLKKIPIEKQTTAESQTSQSCRQDGQTESSADCLLLSDAAIIQSMIHNIGLDHSSQILTIRSHLPHLMTIIRLSTEIILSISIDENKVGEQIELKERQKIAFSGRWTDGNRLEQDLSFKETLAHMSAYFNAHIAKNHTAQTKPTYVVSACRYESHHDFCGGSNM